MSYYDELTPVHQACREGDATTLKRLHTADPRRFLEILRAHPRTPLWWACKTGHPNVVKLLIELGSPLECIGSATSPLMEAAINGHAAVMRVLLESGVDVAEKGGEGGPCGGVLAIAADRGELEMVRMLVEKGADVNEGDSTPLLYACAKGHLEVMKFLVEKGAVLHGGYVLSCAVYNKQEKVVHWLLQSAGVKVDALVDGRTALTLAVRDNMEEMARVLLRNGASPHVKLPKGEPMLWHAISRRYLGVARVLLQHQAQVDEAYGGETSLLVAVARGNLEVVEMLWKSGADLNTKNGRSTPLCVAIRNCHWEVAAFLIDRGADVNMRENNKKDDTTSFTPLHLLCLHPDPIACRLASSMVRNGANVNAILESNDVQTGKSSGPPIYYALREGFTDMVWNLVFAGADLECEILMDGFPHTVWEMCQAEDVETKKALFHFWEPETHFRHPKMVRDAIVCVMLVAKRQNWQFDTPIFQHILSLIAYGWLDCNTKSYGSGSARMCCKFM